MISTVAMVLSLAFVGLAVGVVVGILEFVLHKSPSENTLWSKLFDVIRGSTLLRVLVGLLLLGAGIFFPVGFTLVALGVLVPLFGEQSSLVIVPAIILGLLCIVPGQRLGKALIRLRQVSAA